MQKPEIDQTEKQLHSAMAEAIGAIDIDQKNVANDPPPFQTLKPKPEPKPKLANQISGPVRVVPKATVFIPVILLGFAVGFLGSYFLWHNGTEPKAVILSGSGTSTKTPNNPIYKGWATYCKADVGACYKYPSDWTANVVNGYENKAQTAFVAMTKEPTKDSSLSDAYVASIDDLAIPTKNLKVVGLVVGMRPSFAIYDTAYLTSSGIKAGETKNMIVGTYAFTSNSGQLLSLVGTPNSNGYAAISTIQQGRDWFSSADAQAVKKSVQSFYYQ